MKRKSIIAFASLIIVVLMLSTIMFAQKNNKPEGYAVETKRLTSKKDSAWWPEPQPDGFVLYDADGNIVDTEPSEDEVEAELYIPPVAPTANKTNNDDKSTIVAAGIMDDDLEFSYSEPDPTHEVDPSYSTPEANEPDPTHEVDPSYSSPEEEEPDPTHEVEAYREYITVASEEIDSDEEIGPPIAPPDYYFEETDIIVPELETNSKPLAEEAEAPIDVNLEDESGKIS